MSPKRQNISGLTGIKLLETVNAIKALLAKWEAEHVDEMDGDIDPDRLRAVLDMLTARMDPSSMWAEHLETLNIYWSGELKLKPESRSRALATDSVVEEELWSADGLYRHLCLLEGIVPRNNEAAARLWIEAFFFRVASMSPGTSKLVLSVDPNVLPIPSGPLSAISGNTLSGHLNFMAILTSERHAWHLLHLQRPVTGPEDRAFFVAEAKGPDLILDKHVPQALCEMHACAKRLNKTIIRGALTNGIEWIFMVLVLDQDGDGGKYFESEHIKLRRLADEGGEVSREASSLIAAVIAYWIEHSHEEIGSDDYLTMAL
ncbi:hypothetical protein H0H81_000599 [Sphagnurus paluster]|uniref:Uncharacterized protein n=1 Tax=Sphagnurus paluster TaxID=117069 RepID=A0A9P7KFC3_9AGAR|nr:hypothetical protein H0H81_000599 [Sphagnurus paluster]